MRSGELLLLEPVKLLLGHGRHLLKLRHGLHGHRGRVVHQDGHVRVGTGASGGFALLDQILYFGLLVFGRLAGKSVARVGLVVLHVAFVAVPINSSAVLIRLLFLRGKVAPDLTELSTDLAKGEFGVFALELRASLFAEDHVRVRGAFGSVGVLALLVWLTSL